jgi:hypothetical protein
MIAGVSRKYAIGEVFMVSQPLPSKWEKDDTAIPAKVIRASSKKEFVSYWMQHDPVEYLNSVRKYGESNAHYFYEISVD